MKKSNIVLIILLAIVPVFASAALTRQLQIGSSGADVSELQTFLASDPSVYPQGLITGYFGSLTSAAVRRFQAKNGISQVGRVGPQTMAAINSQMGGTASGQSSPGFTSLASVSMNGNRATVNVTTDVPTRATLYYGTSPLSMYENIASNPVTVTVGGTAVSSNTNLQTSHSIQTLPLLSNTLYYYVVVVTDANGRVSLTYPRWTFNSGSF